MKQYCDLADGNGANFLSSSRLVENVTNIPDVLLLEKDFDKIIYLLEDLKIKHKFFSH